MKAEETARIASDGTLIFSYAGATATDLTAAVNEVASISSANHTSNQAELAATQVALGFDARSQTQADPADFRDGDQRGLISAPAATAPYVKIFLDHPAEAVFQVSLVLSVQVQNMSEAFEQEDLDLNTVVMIFNKNSMIHKRVLDFRMTDLILLMLPVTTSKRTSLHDADSS